MFYSGTDVLKWNVCPIVNTHMSYMSYSETHVLYRKPMSCSEKPMSYTEAYVQKWKQMSYNKSPWPIVKTYIYPIVEPMSYREHPSPI